MSPRQKVNLAKGLKASKDRRGTVVLEDVLIANNRE